MGGASVTRRGNASIRCYPRSEIWWALRSKTIKATSVLPQLRFFAPRSCRSSQKLRLARELPSEQRPAKDFAMKPARDGEAGLDKYILSQSSRAPCRRSRTRPGNRKVHAFAD